jgi:hypothetical protein
MQSWIKLRVDATSGANLDIGERAVHTDLRAITWPTCKDTYGSFEYLCLSSALHAAIYRLPLRLKRCDCSIWIFPKLCRSPSQLWCCLSFDQCFLQVTFQSCRTTATTSNPIPHFPPTAAQISLRDNGFPASGCTAPLPTTHGVRQRDHQSLHARCKACCMSGHIANVLERCPTDAIAQKAC